MTALSIVSLAASLVQLVLSVFIAKTVYKLYKSK